MKSQLIICASEQRSCFAGKVSCLSEIYMWLYEGGKKIDNSFFEAPVADRVPQTVQGVYFDRLDKLGSCERQALVNMCYARGTQHVWPVQVFAEVYGAKHWMKVFQSGHNANGLEQAREWEVIIELNEMIELGRNWSGKFFFSYLVNIITQYKQRVFLNAKDEDYMLVHFHNQISISSELHHIIKLGEKISQIYIFLGSMSDRSYWKVRSSTEVSHPAYLNVFNWKIAMNGCDYEMSRKIGWASLSIIIWNSPMLKVWALISSTKTNAATKTNAILEKCFHGWASLRETL